MFRKILGQEPRPLNLHARDVEAAGDNGVEAQQTSARDDAAQPCARTATRVENADRAGAGFAQIDKYSLDERPYPSIGVAVRSAEGERKRWIAVGIGFVVGAGLVVCRRDARGGAADEP